MTDKSGDRVRHFNTILARRGRNLNNPGFESSNAPGGEGGDIEVSSSSVHYLTGHLLGCGLPFLARKFPHSSTVSVMHSCMTTMYMCLSYSEDFFFNELSLDIFSCR